MSNNHYEKWIIKAPVGFILVSGGIFFMYYSLTQLESKDRWAIYGLISAAAVAIGAALLSSASVHKMKSDMIKKKKAKQESGSDD